MKFLIIAFILLGIISQAEDYAEHLEVDIVFEEEEINEKKEPKIIGGKSVKFENQLNYLRVPKKNSEIRIFKKEDKDGESEETSGEENSKREEVSTVGEAAES